MGVRGLDLDERKRKILKAIIRNYLETGEPVGSRTISKYTDLNLSSATIRNEMADLEELGYIIQPRFAPQTRAVLVTVIIICSRTEKAQCHWGRKQLSAIQT